MREVVLRGGRGEWERREERRGGGKEEGGVERRGRQVVLSRCSDRVC